MAPVDDYVRKDNLRRIHRLQETQNLLSAALKGANCTHGLSRAQRQQDGSILEAREENGAGEMPKGKDDSETILPNDVEKDAYEKKGNGNGMMSIDDRQRQRMRRTPRRRYRAARLPIPRAQPSTVTTSANAARSTTAGSSSSTRTRPAAAVPHAEQDQQDDERLIQSLERKHAWPSEPAPTTTSSPTKTRRTTTSRTTDTQPQALRDCSSASSGRGYPDRPQQSNPAQ